MMTQPLPQAFEAAFWGDCTNTFGEEAKQLTYAPRMGLVNTPQNGHWPVYDLQGRSVLDLGGGPVSMLLKTVNGGSLTVVDPLPVPDWVKMRYETAGIALTQVPAEDGIQWHGNYDEVWIYNVLQHVETPQAVIATAKRNGSLLRIFEWLEIPPHEGHPNQLHADELNEWIDGHGTVENVNENGAVGLCYYGAFPL